MLRTSAKSLLDKYLREGLRTPDSIQLASILEVRDDIEVLFTSDKVLASVSTLEGIVVVKE